MSLKTLLYGPKGIPVESIPTVLKTEKIYDTIVKKIEEISGENIYTCFQCGKCSAGCPLSEKMEHPPNQIIKLLQMGDYDALLSSDSIWMCASCYTCAARCPKGISLCAVTDGVRQLILRKNYGHLNPSAFTQEVKEKMPQMAAVAAFRKFTG